MILTIRHHTIKNGDAKKCTENYFELCNRITKGARIINCLMLLILFGMLLLDHLNRIRRTGFYNEVLNGLLALEHTVVRHTAYEGNKAAKELLNEKGINVHSTSAPASHKHLPPRPLLTFTTEQVLLFYFFYIRILLTINVCNSIRQASHSSQSLFLN